jgi:anti-sigma regulatory factor (Ser/Thr protein kinase)
VKASSEDVLELSLPADPALALTARMFAGALAEHLDDVSPDDLKLALSELLASAVDAGTETVEFRADLGRGQIVVRGAGDVLGGGRSEPVSSDTPEGFARTHRSDLIAALLPTLRRDDDMLVLRLGRHE